MQEKVEIVKADGTKASLDLISEFEINNGSLKKYVLMTANELDQNGLIKILASQISDGKIIKIESDEDWTAVKNVMRSIISSSKGEFTYTNTSDNMSFSVPDDYARVIAVQEVAKQALVDDYEKNKPAVQVVQQEQADVADPKAGIYPTEKVVAPIGSEVVPGIAEVIAENATEETAETLESPETPVTNEAAPEPTPTIEENTAPQVSNNAARDILISEITAAVDKYLESIDVKNIKDTIAKMQEELNSIKL